MKVIYFLAGLSLSVLLSACFVIDNITSFARWYNCCPSHIQ